MPSSRKTLGLVARLVVVVVPLGCALIIAYQVRSARALGPPTTTPLAYTGSLQTFGAPDNATHTMWVGLYVAGSVACATLPAPVTCVNGQFTIPLTSDCLTIVQQNPNVQVEVNVDGTGLGLVSVAAVPYSIEAGTAASVAAGDVTGVLGIGNGGTGSAAQNFVDLSNTQTVGGAKTFSSLVTANGGLTSNGAVTVAGANELSVGTGGIATTGSLNVSGTIRGASYGFGGIYILYVGTRGTVCGGGASFTTANSINPITGASSCPAGFTDSIYWSENRCLYDVGSVGFDHHMCWK